MQSLECIWVNYSLSPSKFEKRSFLFPVRPTVHTLPPRKRSFSKNALHTGGIWKLQPAFLAWNESIKTEYFEIANHVISPPEFSSKTQIQNCSAFKILRRSVDVKHLKRFQNENAVFKFLRRSKDETQENSYHCTQPLYRRLHLPVNALAQNMFSRDIKRLSFRCQTFKFPAQLRSFTSRHCSEGRWF